MLRPKRRHFGCFLAAEAMVEESAQPRQGSYSCLLPHWAKTKTAQRVAKAVRRITTFHRVDRLPTIE
jgi:hypothetical protein